MDCGSHPYHMLYKLLSTNSWKNCRFRAPKSRRITGASIVWYNLPATVDNCTKQAVASGHEDTFQLPPKIISRSMSAGAVLAEFCKLVQLFRVIRPPMMGMMQPPMHLHSNWMRTGFRSKPAGHRCFTRTVYPLHSSFFFAFWTI